MLVSEDGFHRMDAQQCLSKLVDEFNNLNPDLNRTQFVAPPLKKWIVEWRNPDNRGSITKVQRELDETKIILHKTIESVLERGEKIDTLVEKSDQLGFQSRMFYQQSKKQNSCCIVM